ncbi:MAG TPA: quinohemoprotein amine dehydrogenase maturation protein [Bryobacteraceae bacterium]|nr:quinohemoprotein amine dehydrogenase maturation protein [Bryobacteraceae bacterium]
MSASAVSSQANYKLREYHGFESAGNRFLYVVPSGAIFALNDIGREILESLGEQERAREELVEGLLARGYQGWDIETALMELEQSEVIARGDSVPEQPKFPARAFPLQRIVLNVTNQCNLACGYCYEYSDDKISKTDGKPKYMGLDIAQSAIDMLIKESEERPSIHVTFFGGETLLNFPLLRETVAYAKDKSAAANKSVEFSLTTNATLLTEPIVDFLAEHRVGVTVSIDGDRELNDRMRVFHDGRGSYDIIVPRIKMLLQRHHTNSIGARVTLSSGVAEVRRIYQHLTQEVGFAAVGFSPATANPDRLYHIGTQKMSSILGGFEELAWEYRDRALEGRQHGFTNVNDTLKELHSGISKAYPCGAGLGLLGVGTAGDISLCHRFVDSPVGKMGHVNEGGVDHPARQTFLETHNLASRYDCHTCWARPVCAGGCYHEAFVHYGDTSAANLHYCDWIRGWNDLCLRIYGEISVANPSFLNRFNEN